MPLRGKVLMIDDDEDFKASVRSLLESEGYAVADAGSGRHGLEKLREERPDVILLDLMMDCCTDGYGVNQAIKFKEEFREFRGIPIIMISAVEQTPDELFSLAGELDMIRPDYYLTKPLDPSRLLELLKKSIHSS